MTNIKINVSKPRRYANYRVPNNLYIILISSILLALFILKHSIFVIFCVSLLIIGNHCFKLPKELMFLVLIIITMLLITFS